MVEYIERFVLQWNYKYPVDRWWREKHKIAFNAPEHRICNFWDQYFEYKEDLLYDKLTTKDEYVINENDWLEIHEEKFDNIQEGVTSAMEELEKFKSSLK